MATWDAAKCRNDHFNPNVALECTRDPGNCSNLIILNHTVVDRTAKRNAVVFAILLVLSGLVVGVLLRQDPSPWAIYGLAALGIVNAFLIAYSRGRALGAATISTIVATALLGLAQLVDPPPTAAAWLSFVVFFAAAGYALVAGSATVLPTLRAWGTLLIMFVVGVLGIWWAVAVCLAAGASYAPLLFVVVLVGATVPLYSTFLAMRRSGTGSAAYLIVFSVYLLVMPLVSRVVVYLLTVSLPDVLRLARPAPMSAPALLLPAAWLIGIGVTCFSASLTIVLVSAYFGALHEFRANDYSHLDGPTAAARARVLATQNIIDRQFARLGLVGAVLARRLLLLAAFVALWTRHFLRRLWAMVKEIFLSAWKALRFFVLPVTVLGAAAIVLLGVSRDVSAYLSGDLDLSPPVLWSSIVFGLVLVLLLCGLAFGGAPLATRPTPIPPELSLEDLAAYQRWSLNGVGSVILISLSYWVLLSGGALGQLLLSVLLGTLGSASSLTFGPLLWTNLIVGVLLLTLVLVVHRVASAFSRGQSSSTRVLGSTPAVAAAGTMGVAAVLVLGVGSVPAAGWIRDLLPGQQPTMVAGTPTPTPTPSAGPTVLPSSEVSIPGTPLSTTARAVVTRLPTAIWDTSRCRSNTTISVGGVLAAINCPTVSPGPTKTPLILQFSSSDAVESYLAGFSRSSSGSCSSSRWPYSSTWSSGQAGGFLICDGSSPYRMIWSIRADNVVILAEGTNAADLRDWWESSNAPLLACTATNTVSYSISDGTTAESAIRIAGCARRSVSLASIEVAIDHTCRNDLAMSLVAPSGRTYSLVGQDGTCDDDIRGMQTVELDDENTSGTWWLRVADTSTGDVGIIERWSLTI